MSPTVGSLFSGIGGLDLGLERAGWEVRWQSEIDDYCSRVLKKHWPHVPNLGDVTAIDWSGVERVDLICGGFPCQDISFVGKRAGLSGSKSGLWRNYADAVRELRPRFVFVENVTDLAIRGMGDVLGDLAAVGYDAEWGVIPAAAVGAHHLRARIWILAYPRGFGNGLASGSVFVRRKFPIDGFVWDAEPDVGRVADGVPSRVDRLRALGNAVVPQVAEFIGTQLLSAISAAA